MNPHPNYAKAQGFTFVEIMVVLAVLAIALSIAMVSVGNARVRTEQRQKIELAATLIRSVADRSDFNDANISMAMENGYLVAKQGNIMVVKSDLEGLEVGGTLPSFSNGITQEGTITLSGLVNAEIVYTSTGAAEVVWK